ncbi:zf-HC2 domain-containing protein [Bacillus sp. NTK074B]|nr:zf-HC2 domain-containing protein [Bacillus sp. NTK074B]
MKKCNIVQDLLPSYIDEICSGDSREFVQEHLSLCKECREIYINMKSGEDIEDDLVMERIESKKPFQKVSVFFQEQKKLTRSVFVSALIFLLIGILLLGNSIMIMNENKKELHELSVVKSERNMIMEDVFHTLHSSSNAEEYESEIQDIFNQYDDKLQYLAVFKTDDLQEWLANSSEVKEEPTNIYPVDYRKAEVVFGSEGIISNKAEIIPGEYDLGNVVLADDNWIVQFEYKESYERTIERYHQLTYYGPSTLTIYWPPILFISIFSILFIIWLWLRKHNDRLKDVMG